MRVSEFELNINYSFEQMDLNKKRVQARNQFQYFDRVPVGFCIEPRYFTPIFGIDYKEIFKDAQSQYNWMLQFAKYRIENIPEDMYCQSPTIVVSPYFDNVPNSNAFGAAIAWHDNDPLQACSTINTIEEMDSLEVPAPDAGIWSKMLDWWQQMKKFASETSITFNGVAGEVKVVGPTSAGIGPFTIAIDLIGENFYWWIIEYPEKCHNFLSKITKGLIQAEKYFRKLDTEPRNWYGLAEDSAQIISADMFKKFCVPYVNELYERLGKGCDDGRGMHMCGNSTHLHKALVEDIKISSFNVFGFPVKPSVAAKNLGGKTRLWGNISPMLIKDGTKDEIKAAAMECLTELAPHGGFMLGDGANVCPGTPLENLSILTEASKEYGCPVIS
jgi:uroporphyrinogen decarboxylase